MVLLRKGREYPMHLKSDEKHKVTVYLASDLHRQVKVRAALEEEPMSAVVERALDFYLHHADLVEERLGQTHRLYSCPACETAVVIRNGELNHLPESAPVLLEDHIAPLVAAVREVVEEPVLSCR